MSRRDAAALAWRFDELAVRFYGATAVATSRYTSKSQFKEKLTGVTSLAEAVDRIFIRGVSGKKPQPPPQGG